MSGWKAHDAAVGHLRSIPGMPRGMEHHVEMQVIKWLHANPNVKEAVLFVDRPPCPRFCALNIEEFLPEGVTLYLVPGGGGRVRYDGRMPYVS
jgi:hypothetical protein